jgi:cytochrome c-type biogenesis protein CcmH/NrfF
MAIEVLWIIPVVALALFFLILTLSTQQGKAAVSRQDAGLSREVEQFNRGNAEMPVAAHLTDQRLESIQNTIQMVTSALSNQQQIIENVQGKDVRNEMQLRELNEKLQSLQQEYDIVISENYSLKARLRQLVGPAWQQQPEQLPPGAANAQQPAELATQLERMIGDTPNLTNIRRLYDDTRTFKPQDLDDTSEISLSELR